MLNWLQMRSRYTFLAIALLAFASCDSNTVDQPAANTNCPAGAAMISLTDGYLETLCGCAEASPSYFGPGSRLTCTVTAGTIVFFNYTGTNAVHQIVSVGTPSFGASAISDPNDGVSMIRVYAAQFSSPGTYAFEDAFNNGLAGDIIAL
jgi:hypothetical protein